MCDCFNQSKSQEQKNQHVFSQQTIQIQNTQQKKYDQSFSLSKQYFPNTQIIGQDVYKKLLEDLKSKKRNFIDPDFKHQINSLTPQPISINIAWKRISQLRENISNKPLVDSRISTQLLAQFHHDNPALKSVLKTLSQKNLLEGKTLFFQQIPQGIYAFKFKIKGRSIIVVVDDYIPSYKNRLIFTPAIGQNFYLPLLQKALAKVYKTYEQIPHDQSILFDVISNLPHITFQIRKTNKQQIKQILENPNYFCISKSNEYWGSVNTCYYNVLNKNEKILLRRNADQQSHEINQNYYREKFNFLHVWILKNPIKSYYLNINKKQQLYKFRCQKYRSELIITYENQLQSRVQLLFITDQFQLIKANTVISSKSNQIRVHNITVGVYYLYLNTDAKNTGLLTMHTPDQFKIYDQQLSDNFMSQFFQKHSELNKSQNKYLDSNSFLTMRILFQQLGMAYIYINLSKKYNNKLILQFNVEKLKDHGYEIMAPYKNEKEIKKILKGENKLIIKFLLMPSLTRSIQFPPPVSFQQITT